MVFCSGLFKNLRKINKFNPDPSKNTGKHRKMQDTIEKTRKIRKIKNMKKINKKNNTYKGKLSKIYAGQASKVHEKAAFTCIVNFLVRQTKKTSRKTTKGH